LDFEELRIFKQVWQADGTIRVEVIARTESATCPHCQRESRSIHDCRARPKRDLPLRGYQVHLILWKRRFRCKFCQKTFTEPDTACGWRRRTTARLRERLGKQAVTQPIAAVAAACAVGPRFVQACLHQVAQTAIEESGGQLNETGPLPTPRFLGIDEFAVRKGHRYETILCDLEQRCVLEVSAGRTQEEVVALLKRLQTPEVVEAVSMDRSASFRPAVKAVLPQAQIVVDHFHVIQHIMKAFRKVVSSWAHKKESRILLHRKQHLFLRAKESLTAEQEQERAQIADRLPALKRAWELKEALRSWYATATAQTAAAELDAWIKLVREEGPDPLQKALSAFAKWREEILAFFQFLPTHRISNGFVEGKNNRTKQLMRQAYGYRNRRHLRLRILLGNVA
jgi:transposase